MCVHMPELLLEETDKLSHCAGMRVSSIVSAQIGRLASPKAEMLGTSTEDKAKDFFREV